MLEVHAILHRQRCYENMIEKTGILSDAYKKSAKKSPTRKKKTFICVVGSTNNRIIHMHAIKDMQYIKFWLLFICFIFNQEVLDPFFNI